MKCKFCGCDDMYKVEDLRSYTWEVEEWKCPKCKSKVQFDSYILRGSSERKVRYNWFTNLEGRG